MTLGELGFTCDFAPMPNSMAPSLETFGSGKFGTACARMQRAYSRPARSYFACSCELCRPPLGRSLLHACWAFVNSGERGSIPFSAP